MLKLKKCIKCEGEFRERQFKEGDRVCRYCRNEAKSKELISKTREVKEKLVGIKWQQKTQAE